MLVTLEKIGKVERPAVTSLDVAETFGKEHKMYCVILKI